MNAHIELEKPGADNPERQVSDTVAAVAGLKSRDCKWPIGEPDKPGFRFCSAKAVGYAPYCLKHLRQSAAGGVIARTPKPRRQKSRGPNQLANYELQWRIFEYLRTCREGVPLPPGPEIAKAVGAKYTSVNASIQRLRQRGWIERTPFRLIHDPFANEVTT